MKSDRRHELKENVLAKDLGLAGDFVKTHLNWIIGAVSVALIIVAIAYYTINRARMTRAQEWAQYYQMTSSSSGETPDQKREKLLSLAESTSQKPLAAWASLEAANVSYNQLMIKLGTLDQAARQDAMNQVATAYQQIVSQYGDQPQPLAYAHIGLGLLAETQRNMDQARQEYQKAAELRTQGAAIAANEADQHLKELDQLAQPVVMAPGNPPAAASQPAPAPGGAELGPIVPDEETSLPATNP